MSQKGFLSLFGKSKKKDDGFDALSEDISQIESSKQNSTGKKSFYDSGEDILYEAPKEKGFYGVKDVDDERADDEKRRIAQHNVFNFSWWEYAIIFIEFFLLVYVILLFFGVFSI